MFYKMFTGFFVPWVVWLQCTWAHDAQRLGDQLYDLQMVMKERKGCAQLHSFWITSYLSLSATTIARATADPTGDWRLRARCMIWCTRRAVSDKGKGVVCLYWNLVYREEMCDGPKKYSSKPEARKSANRAHCQVLQSQQVNRFSDFWTEKLWKSEKVQIPEVNWIIEVGPNLQVVTVSPEWTRKTVKSSEPWTPCGK